MLAGRSLPRIRATGCIQFREHAVGGNHAGHESIKTTADMYGTLSIEEMQEIAAGKIDG